MEPITSITATHGVFLAPPDANRSHKDWQAARFGPVELLAVATDHHSAAMAACLYLVATNEPGAAVIVRDRAMARNLALIEWNESHGPGGGYRYSVETWCQGFPRLETIATERCHGARHMQP